MISLIISVSAPTQLLLRFLLIMWTLLFEFYKENHAPSLIIIMNSVPSLCLAHSRCSSLMDVERTCTGAKFMVSSLKISS